MEEIAAENVQFNHKKADLLVNCIPILREIRKSGKLCDISLKVKDRTISAHRVILAATVPYFYKMFCADNQESDKKMEIIMQEFDPDLIENLIDYCYSGEIQIGISNINNLLICANIFELVDIKEACVKFMGTNLNSTNAIFFSRIAVSNKLDQAIVDLEDFICNNFSEVSESQDFAKLEAHELIKIIEKSEIKVSTEEKVYEAALKWVKMDEESRIAFLPEVLRKVRLSYLAPEYLVNVVSNENLIRQSIECRDVLEEAKNHQLLSLRSNWTSKICNIEPRQYENEVIYLICGSNNNLKNCIMAYKQRKWTEVAKLSQEKKWFGGTLMNGKIYIVGGMVADEYSSSVEIFDIMKNEWSEGVESKTAIYAPGVASFNNCIYVCGGRGNYGTQSSVRCFSEPRNEWKKMAPLNFSRCLFKCVSLNGFIYAIGGRNFDVVNQPDSCEKYCPIKNKWTFIQPMTIDRYAMGVAVLNEKIYAVEAAIRLTLI